MTHFVRTKKPNRGKALLSNFFISAMLRLLQKLFIEFNHHIVDMIPFFLQKLITAPILPYISRNHRRNLKNLDWFRTLKTFTRLTALFVQIIDVLNLISSCLFFSKCSISVVLYCVLLAFDSSTVTSVVWVWQELVNVWSRTPLGTKPLIESQNECRNIPWSICRQNQETCIDEFKAFPTMYSQSQIVFTKTYLYSVKAN